MLEIVEIRNRWGKEEPLFKTIAKYTIDLLKHEIGIKKLNVEITWRTKDFLSIVKKIKKKSREEKDYSYESVGDKLGIRIVCSFSDELEIIDTLIKDTFNILKRDIKRENFKFNSLEYSSNHYDVCLKTDKRIKNIDNPSEFQFEIQARTINQDAWAKMTHKLSYKNELEVSDNLKRAIYRLITLYELADEEFNRVNQQLILQSDTVAYLLIRSLEKYVYQFASTDFDRETSEYYIGIILSFLDPELLNLLPNKVEKFIQDKEESILAVYRQEDAKLSEHYWLTTQPEVFLIWFCIDHHFYVLRDNWSHFLDFKELEFLATIWGKSITGGY